jgi:hypothetical protein
MNTAIDHRTGLPQQQIAQLDYILLDGSSSMIGTQWDPCLSAIDAYIDGLRAANIDTRTIFSIFNSSSPGTIHRDGPISEWIDFRRAYVSCPGGGTPLYDAIATMGSHLRDLDPTRAAVTIATDGFEGGSQFTDEVQAHAILEWMRAKGWQVTFIGCDFNNSKLAAKLGGTAGSYIGVQKRLLSDAARNLAKKRTTYALYGQDMHFSDDEKQQFGGYLASK